MIGAQNAEWLRMAKDRRDPKRIETQLQGLYLPAASRILYAKHRDFDLGTAGDGEKERP